MRRQFVTKVLLTTGVTLSLALPASAVIHNVTVGNNFFAPLKTTVNPGDIVRWTFVGGIPHSTTSDVSSSKQWDSDITAEAGFTFDVQFLIADGPGPFPYHCTVHSLTMKDTIFVVTVGSCCVSRVGDANGLGGDEPTIGDVSVMIDAKFITGSCGGILGCLAEADLNQSGGSNPTCDDVTIGDISYLIDYLFITGPSLGLNDCL